MSSLTSSPRPEARATGNVSTTRRFNGSQLQALDLSCHVAVTAAAGSGKTTVLVERFLRLLEKNGFNPEQIVALTFTEEAAGQLRQKIREAVTSRAAQRSGDSANPWEVALRKLEAAPITTIHGFCAFLLLERSSETPDNGAFRVASPGEQQALLRSSIRQCLDRLSRQGDPELASLMEYRGFESIERTLIELVSRRGYLGRIDTGEPGLENLCSIYRQETAGFLCRSPEVTALRERLALIPTYLSMEGDSCSRRCRAQQALFAGRRRLSPVEFIRRLQASLRGRVSPTRRWRQSRHYKPLLACWSDLRALFKQRPLDLPGGSPGEDHHYHRAITALHQVYQEVLSVYRRNKERSGVLDFDDLLERAAELVRDPLVRDSLRERYPFLLVDEFQDTNWVQWRLLRPLIGPDSNFMAVGDAKQSIYRFRDADVGIFGQVQVWVASRGPDRGKVVEMPENYRSSASLVAFVNRVFRRLFDRLFDYEAEHQEMQPLRKVESDRGDPPVQACYLDEDDPDEAEVAAAWIRRLLSAGEFTPRQVAVLLRTRTRLRRYEAALRKAGVPFRTVGAGGFFQRQEVMDLICLLRWLVDPDDSVALVGVLRSPFFSFSDEDLFEISLSPGADFLERLQTGAGLSSSERPHWKEALTSLQRLRASLGVRSAAEELSRFLEESGYLEIVARSRDSLRQIANLEKFLRLTRELEQEGGSSPRRLLRLLGTLSTADTGEPEAALDSPDVNAVSIYTFHGAKGLQFPVVMLPDLGVPFSDVPSDQFQTHTVQDRDQAHSYFGIKIRNPDQGYRELAHPVYEAVRCLNEYRRLAEEKRLLYVAMTRAEDRLLLLGRRGKRPGYLQWLIESGSETPQISIPELNQWLCKSRPEGDPESGGETPAPAETAIELRPRRPHDLPLRKTSWTPTEIVRYHECPRRYYLASIAGHREENPLAEASRATAATLGSAIHEMLDRVGLNTDPQRQSREIEACSDRLAPGLDLSRKALIELLDSHLRNFQNSPLAQEMSAAVRMDSEKAFTLTLGKDPEGAPRAVVRGALDKLFQRSDGTWVVVDFKTNSPPQSRQAMAPYRRQVELYLWAVSRLLSTEQVAGVLFLTHDGQSVPVEWDDQARESCRVLLRRLPSTWDLSSYPRTSNASACEGCGFMRQGLCPGAARQS